MNRPVAGQVEERSEALGVEGRRIRGVIPYGRQSADMGGWREVISPGALRGAKMDALVARVDHAGVPLGRFPGTLTIEDRDDGAHWSVEPPASRQDIVEAVSRGDLKAGSWRMIVGRDHWVGDVRHVDEIRELRDVSVVTNPAYEDALVELRSNPQDQKEQTMSTSVPDTGNQDQHEQHQEEAQEGTENRSQQENSSEAGESRQKPENRSQGRLRVEDRRQEQVGETRVMDALAEELHRVSPGESRALSDSISIAPPQVGQVLFDRLRAQAVMLQTGIRTMPIGAKAETWPTITGDIAPAVYAEGLAITPSDPTFGSVTATPKKIAALVQLDNEVIDDSSPAAVSVLNDHLLKVFALTVDKQLLEGAGFPQITGLKNLAGIQTLSAGANGASATFDTLMDALALLDAVNVPRERVAVVGHTRNLATLRKLRSTANGEYLMESALPAMGLNANQFYWTPQLSTNETMGTSTTTNSIYLFDTQNVIYVPRTSLQIVLDRSRLFNSDQSELRATMRADLIVPSPNAVVRVTGFTS